MRIILVALLSLAPAGAAAALPASVDGQDVPSLAPILEEVMPSVVNVNTQTRVKVRSPFMDDPFFRRFFNMPNVPRERIEQSLGSGVIVDADNGYILTNNHVVERADDIAVTLHDGRTFEARIIGTDRETDLAVIRIDADNLKALPLDTSDDLRVGDFAVAVGNPFGLGQTVTSGIVSALGRAGVRGLEYQNFIQTDASINPGNSGGALINLHGELIGINTAIFTPSGGNVGIGFSIPASMARHVMDQLVAHGEVRRGSLGVKVQDLSTELADAFGLEDRRGAVVTRVIAESAAAEAGMQSGDVILAVDGQRIGDAQALRNSEGLLPLDEKVMVRFLREGEERSARLRVRENLDEEIGGGRLDPSLEGVSLRRLPERVRFDGVLVEAVRRNTRAWEVGLRAGDIIVAMNREPVADLAELRARFPAGDALELDIRRQGRGYRLRLK